MSETDLQTEQHNIANILMHMFKLELLVNQVDLMLKTHTHTLVMHTLNANLYEFREAICVKSLY